MNYYTLEFNYAEEDFKIVVDANKLANSTVMNKSPFFEEFMHKENQVLLEPIIIADNPYLIMIDTEFPDCVCLYNADTEYDGISDNERWYPTTVCQNNIPYVCIKVEDEKGRVLYERE